MILTRAAFDEYDSRIEKLSKAAYNAAYKRMVNYTEQFENASVAQTRDFAIETVSAAVTAYGDAVSTCAADLYDEMAETSGAKLSSAALDTEDVTEYIDKEVRFQAGKLSDGNVSDFVTAVAKAAQMQTLRKANSTMMKNVKRDGLRYARVPMGGETCTFCVMLASRGFVYLSAKTAGEGTHYHNHCRCKVVPSFDKKGNATTVEGYDPDELYTQWKEYEKIDRLKIPLFDKKVLKVAYCLGEEKYQAVQSAIKDYVIAETKLTKYSLSLEKEPDKARAFKGYLGYTVDDAETVAALTHAHVAKVAPSFRNESKYGLHYTTKMVMDGKGDKSAKVTAGWIKRDNENKISLTTIYVDE
jgi:hypothetical protein